MSVPIASQLPPPPLGPESSGEMPAEQLDDVLGHPTAHLNDLVLPSPESSAGVNKTWNGKMRRKLSVADIIDVKFVDSDQLI